MIFFDIDGTLIDHQKAQDSAIVKLCAYFNIVHIPPKILAQQWKKISDNYYQQYLAGACSFHEQRIMRLKTFFMAMKSRQDNLEEVLTLYLKFYKESWILYDDVLPTLEQLRPKARLGIISNGQTEQQHNKLIHFGIMKYFEIIIISETIGCVKPNKSIFITAADAANSPVSHCYYVGDDLENDAVAASTASMIAIWLNRKNLINDVSSRIKMVTTLFDLSSIKCHDDGLGLE